MADQNFRPENPHPAHMPSLRADQRAIAEDAARFKVVACGRRWGKTTLGLVLAAQLARRGRRVWWVAPTYGLAFQPWRALKISLAGEWTAKLESERFIELPGGGSVTVKSGEDPDSLRGVGLDFVVVDEAAFMSEEAWFSALRPALSDRKGSALIISTPRGRNWFWRVHNLGNDPLHGDWLAYMAPTADNPLIQKDEVESARSVLSERIFRQEYEAEFLPDGGEVFHNVRGAVSARIDSVPQPGHRYYMGVDFGRYHDFTVAVVIDADQGAVVALERFNMINWDLQRSRILALARHYNVLTTLAEANAMGEPNIEALRQEGLFMGNFTMSARSKPPLIETLVKAIGEGDLKLPDDPQLSAELEAYTYRTNAYGQAIYGAPSGQHDDIVIALALAWKLASTPRLALGIAAV